ncbi:hypothetical protein ACWGQL_14725 [Streptomyces lydicus]
MGDLNGKTALVTGSSRIGGAGDAALLASLCVFNRLGRTIGQRFDVTGGSML